MELNSILRPTIRKTIISACPPLVPRLCPPHLRSSRRHRSCIPVAGTFTPLPSGARDPSLTAITSCSRRLPPERVIQCHRRKKLPPSRVHLLTSPRVGCSAHPSLLFGGFSELQAVFQRDQGSSNTSKTKDKLMNLKGNRRARQHRRTTNGREAELIQGMVTSNSSRCQGKQKRRRNRFSRLRSDLRRKRRQHVGVTSIILRIRS